MLTTPGSSKVLLPAPWSPRVAGVSSLSPSGREGSSVKGQEGRGSQGRTCPSASARGHPSRLLANEGHLPRSTSRERRGRPDRVAGDPREIPGGCPNHHQPRPSHRPPPQPLPTSTEMLPRGQSPPVPHWLLSQTVSLCLAGKKKQNLYSFLWQLHKYKYVGKYLQTPELKGDMERELNYRLQGVIKQYLGFPRLVILFLFCMIYYAGKTFFSSQFLFIFFLFCLRTAYKTFTLI